MDGGINMEQLSFYDYTISTSTVTEIKECNNSTVVTAESIESKDCQLNNQKGGFWKKAFRRGHCSSKSARYEGKLYKTDANTSRSKLKRFLNKYIQ